MQVPIPDDWNGTDWIDICVQFPNSLKWLALWDGILTQFMRGRFWKGETGVITDAQAVGREIYDRNTPIVEGICDMRVVTDVTVDCESDKLVITYSDDTESELTLDCLLPDLVNDVSVDLNTKLMTVSHTIDGNVEFDLSAWFQFLVTRVFPNCADLTLHVEFDGGATQDFDMSCLCSPCSFPPKADTPSIIEPDECDIAYNAAMIFLENVRADIGTALDGSEDQYGIAIAMRERVQDIMYAPSAAYFLWFTSLIEGQTLLWWESLIETQDLNDFGCAYYCALMLAPDDTKEQYLMLTQYLEGKYPGSENLAFSFFYAVLSVVQVNGLASAVAYYQSTGHDCSACVCGCLFVIGGAGHNTGSSYVSFLQNNVWELGTGMIEHTNDCRASMKTMVAGTFKITGFTDETGLVNEYGYLQDGETEWDYTDNKNEIIGLDLQEFALLADVHTGATIRVYTDCNEPETPPVEWWFEPSNVDGAVGTITYEGDGWYTITSVYGTYPGGYTYDYVRVVPDVCCLIEEIEVYNYANSSASSFLYYCNGSYVSWPASIQWSVVPGKTCTEVSHFSETWKKGLYFRAQPRSEPWTNRFYIRIKVSVV